MPFLGGQGPGIVATTAPGGSRWDRCGGTSVPLSCRCYQSRGGTFVLVEGLASYVEHYCSSLPPQVAAVEGSRYTWPWAAAGATSLWCGASLTPS